MTDLESFTTAYIEAMYFADTGGDTDIPADAQLSEESRLDIEADCRSFWRRFGPYILTEICQGAFQDAVSQAGQDFYFTRNGHGVGFWEDEWPEAYRDMLTNGAKAYGELIPYIGDDDLVYV